MDPKEARKTLDDAFSKEILIGVPSDDLSTIGIVIDNGNIVGYGYSFPVESRVGKIILEIARNPGIEYTLSDLRSFTRSNGLIRYEVRHLEGFFTKNPNWHWTGNEKRKKPTYGAERIA